MLADGAAGQRPASGGNLIFQPRLPDARVQMSNSQSPTKQAFLCEPTDVLAPRAGLGRLRLSGPFPVCLLLGGELPFPPAANPLLVPAQNRAGRDALSRYIAQLAREGVSPYISLRRECAKASAGGISIRPPIISI